VLLHTRLARKEVVGEGHDKGLGYQLVGLLEHGPGKAGEGKAGTLELGVLEHGGESVKIGLALQTEVVPSEGAGGAPDSGCAVEVGFTRHTRADDGPGRLRLGSDVEVDPLLLVSEAAVADFGLGVARRGRAVCGLDMDAAAKN